jgi:hypothetical protein
VHDSPIIAVGRRLEVAGYLSAVDIYQAVVVGLIGPIDDFEIRSSQLMGKLLREPIVVGADFRPGRDVEPQVKDYPGLRMRA